MTSYAPTKIEKTKILFVEGKDEENFFRALGVGNDIQIIDVGGKDSFRTKFSLYYKNSDGLNIATHIGFVRDAEQTPAQFAFNNICNVLRANRLPCPQSLTNNINKNNKPYVGIFIMPDNNGIGMLENLCLAAINNYPIRISIDNYINDVKIQLGSNVAQLNEPKARVQTYLASRIPLRQRLGEGALSGHFNFSDPCFNKIKNFLTLLF